LASETRLILALTLGPNEAQGWTRTVNGSEGNGKADMKGGANEIRGKTNRIRKVGRKGRWGGGWQPTIGKQHSTTLGLTKIRLWS
jgi:hypothetical protein